MGRHDGDTPTKWPSDGVVPRAHETDVTRKPWGAAGEFTVVLPYVHGS